MFFTPRFKQLRDVRRRSGRRKDRDKESECKDVKEVHFLFERKKG
jgi:hypothetical protein